VLLRLIHKSQVKSSARVFKTCVGLVVHSRLPRLCTRGRCCTSLVHQLAMAVGLLAIAIAVFTVWVVYQLAVARSRRFPDRLPALLNAADAEGERDREERDAVAKKEQADARVRFSSLPPSCPPSPSHLSSLVHCRRSSVEYIWPAADSSVCCWPAVTSR
jgi:hypothetical protein